MALFDDLIGKAGMVSDIVKKNPALVAAAVGLLSSKQGSIGPSDGLQGWSAHLHRKDWGTSSTPGSPTIPISP